MKTQITLIISLLLMLTGCGGEADSRDTTPPVITLIGESEISVIRDDTYTDQGASATDDIYSWLCIFFD